MRAISAIHLWGDMIANLEKTIEVRSWKPRVLPMTDVALVQNGVRLLDNGQQDPGGQIVAVIDIAECVAWQRTHSEDSGCDGSKFVEGYVAWRITNVRKLARAVDKRRLYDLSSSEAAQVISQMPT